MDVKFTQLYWFSNVLHALDEDGQVWFYSMNDNRWKEFPPAIRNIPVKKTTGSIIKPMTPDQLKERNFKLAQAAIDKELKDNEH